MFPQLSSDYKFNIWLVKQSSPPSCSLAVGHFIHLHATGSTVTSPHDSEEKYQPHFYHTVKLEVGYLGTSGIVWGQVWMVWGQVGWFGDRWDVLGTGGMVWDILDGWGQIGWLGTDEMEWSVAFYHCP